MRKNQIQHKYVIHNTEQNLISTTYLAALTDREHTSIVTSMKQLMYYTKQHPGDYKSYYTDNTGVKRVYYNLPYPTALLIVGRCSAGKNYVYLQAAVQATSLPNLIALLSKISGYSIHRRTK